MNGMLTPKTMLYDQDFFAWTERQAELLKTGQFDEVDIANLIEEIETMGRSERRELMSRLTVLITHLLKWQFQPNLQGHSWLYTIRHQRLEIRQVLQDSPSLKRFLRENEWLQNVWENAVQSAMLETGYTQDMFPTTPIWSIDDVLDSTFFPEQGNSN